MKYIPKWVPGAGFQILAEEGAKASNDMRYLPYYDARDRFVSRTKSYYDLFSINPWVSQLAGTAVKSFTSQQIEECLGPDGQVSKSDEEIISAASGIFYAGESICTRTGLLNILTQ